MEISIVFQGNKPLNSCNIILGKYREEKRTNFLHINRNVMSCLEKNLYGNFTLSNLFFSIFQMSVICVSVL